MEEKKQKNWGYFLVWCFSLFFYGVSEKREGVENALMRACGPLFDELNYKRGAMMMRIMTVKKKIRPRNALILPRPWNRRGHGTNGLHCVLEWCVDQDARIQTKMRKGLRVFG